MPHGHGHGRLEHIAASIEFLLFEFLIVDDGSMTHIAEEKNGEKERYRGVGDWL